MRSDTLAVLDWGHLGQLPPREMHTGAVHEDQIEVYGIAWYLLPLMVSLREAGHSVQIAGQGDYTSRQKAAVLAAREHFKRVAYISCHLNAFPGEDIPNRCVAFYNQHSQGGAELAELAVTYVTGIDTRIILANGGDWTQNAWRVSGGDIIFGGPRNISGICLEPMALNGVPRSDAETLQRLGTQLAIGISQWLDVP